MLKNQQVDFASSIGRSRLPLLGARSEQLVLALLLIVGLIVSLEANSPRDTAAQDSGSALAWAWVPYESAAAPMLDPHYSYNSSGAENTVKRNDVGFYQVTFTGVGQNAGTFLITAQGPATSCTLDDWNLSGSDMEVLVYCYGPGGIRMDSGFSAMYYIAAGSRTGAYIWANDPSIDSYVPDARFSFNSAGRQNTVTRTGVGEYTATFPGVGAEAGNFQAIGQGSKTVSCTISRWELAGTDMNVKVRCFGAGGALADSKFIVTYGTSLFETPGTYFWANEPASASYTPDARYMGSTSGTPSTIVRNDAGDYTATLYGVAEETGNFQVTGQGDAASCSIARWVLTGTDMAIEVLCYGADGAPIDSGFLLAYNYMP